MVEKSLKTSYAVEKKVFLTPAQEKLLMICSQKGDIDDMLESIQWMFNETVLFSSGDIKEEYRTHLFNIDELMKTLRGIQAGF